MAVYDEGRDEIENQVIFGLLNSIENNSEITQRSIAQDLGIALGLANRYLQRGIRKGWIRVAKVSPKRARYFLTPAGFQEKSRMVAHYLTASFGFFRRARIECEQAVELCLENNWLKVAVFGTGDLAGILELIGRGFPLILNITNDVETAANCDGVVITDISHPQKTYDLLQQKIDDERIITLDLLHIKRGS